MAETILVLGGYGNFGKLICDVLARRNDIELIVAGRSLDKAKKFCNQLTADHARCRLTPLALDIHTESFVNALVAFRPFVVMHTSGPFQGQDYRVPKVCIAAGCHYIDLADDRHFVCNFASLNEKAKQHNVIAVSGASSVPGLSSVVIDHYVETISWLETIQFAIVPGSNVKLGEATLKGILSYAGHPFTRWENGKWITRYGWMDSRKEDFGATLGSRWLANVDIPDLELFPSRYAGVRTVRFRAGYEIGLVHLTMNFLAYLARRGWVERWDPYSGILFKSGQLVKKLGSDCGGMVVQLSGRDVSGKRQKITWRLIAKDGVGPRIPTVSAIIIAEKLLNGELTEAGARPCLGMYTLEEFFAIAGNWGIYQEEERTCE